MRITAQADRTLVRVAGRSTRHVLLSFSAPESPRASTRPAVNVAFVIDRSGSMGGSKIGLARQAVIRALRMLSPSDRFSVVSYDTQVDVVVPSTPASGEAVRNAIAQVERLQARGSTNLCGGWLKGCEQVAEVLQPDQIARCILLTDGLANVGVTDRDQLTLHAEELRRRGIATTTIGLGADFDEVLLEQMARAGEGRFYYLETAVQIADCLTSEIGEALEVVARDVVVHVRTVDAVQVTTLNRYTVHQDDEGRTLVKLGDLVSRQDVALVLELTFRAGEEGKAIAVTFGVADAAAALAAADAVVTFTFADHAANTQQPRNVDVDRAVARLHAARAQAEAIELNRASRFDQAPVSLEATARRIEQYACGDPDLLAIVAELRQKVGSFAVAMSSSELKSEHFASTSMSRMRDPSGKARRRGGV